MHLKHVGACNWNDLTRSPPLVLPLVMVAHICPRVALGSVNEHCVAMYTQSGIKYRDGLYLCGDKLLLITGTLSYGILLSRGSILMVRTLESSTS